MPSFNYDDPEVIYQGKRFDFLKFRDRTFVREVVSHPGAAVILPFLDKERILLIKNRRACISRTLIELPAGMLDKGENPLDCASRELEEETGYRAEQVTPLFNFFSTPGFSNEILYSFLATRLVPTKQSLDDSEEIEILPILFQEALKMIQTGEIVDGKTIATLLYYHRFKQN